MCTVLATAAARQFSIVSFRTIAATNKEVVTDTTVVSPAYMGYSGRPAGCGHSKLARARTGLPLTCVQFISVTELVTKFVTKKRNEIFLRRPLKLKFRYAFVVGI